MELLSNSLYRAASFATFEGFGFFLFRQSSEWMRCYANHNLIKQRAHQFRALARRKRNYFNRKSEEVKELQVRPIYNSFGFSVEGFFLPSRKRTTLVSALFCDLRKPASTRMIDGTEKFEVFKTRGAIQRI